MVGLTQLWLPILISAVLVFLASAVIHMALRYHWSDWSVVPGEDKIRAAMRDEGVGPGDYTFPRPEKQSEMNDPALVEKFKQGPVGFLTVIPSGPPAMGKSLALWFVYSVVVGVLAAYMTGRTLAAGTDYMQVFRVAGTTAFLAYAGAEPINSIWFGRKWRGTIKTMFDGLIYALLTGGAFGWLWP
jgi:hypothetical protein